MSHPSVQRLGPPPRALPLLLRLQLILGGLLNQIGWFLLGFGMIFFWVFFMDCEILTWFSFLGEKATTQAVVTASVNTRCRENGRTVYAIEYWYPTVDVSEQRVGPVVLPSTTSEIAQGHRGVSYASGRELTPGTQVTVEYLVRDPAASRIQGFRRTSFGAAAALVAIFPLVGLCLLLSGYSRGRKACRLLEYGNLGEAKLQTKETTNTSINEQTVYKFIFEFRASDGLMHSVAIKTHETEKVEDEAKEKVVYDPFNPDYAVVLDALPGSFVVDEQGLIQTANPLRTLRVAIIPLLTLLGHGLYILYRMG